MLSIIILAIIQGIAEFLPISSSAHLIIFRDLFSIGKEAVSSGLELTFDVALHFGTALAIIVYFFKDFWNMMINGFTKGVSDKKGKILWYIIVASIPASVVGVLFEDVIDSIIRTKYWLIAFALIVMGIIIYLIDKKTPSSKKIDNMSICDAFIIGCSQVFALIPGFSRSGTTIAAGRFLNLEREDAAKFSFYLSAPIVLGAVLLEVIKIDLSIILDNLLMFFLGIAVSFGVGIFCIKFLLKYLKSNDFKLFMWYRLALGIIVLIYLFI